MFPLWITSDRNVWPKFILRFLYKYHITHIFSYIHICINIENWLPTSVVLHYVNTYCMVSHEWKLCIHDQQRLKILLWQFSSYSYNRQKVDNFHFHFFTITFTFTRMFLFLYLSLGHILCKCNFREKKTKEVV